MSISEMFTVLIACVFVNNYTLEHFMGFEHIASDTSKSLKYNFRVSLLLTVVLLIATSITFPLDKWVLSNSLEWARTLSYVLVIAFSVFIVEKLIMTRTTDWLKYDSINVILNSVVLGTLLLNKSYNYDWLTSYVAVIGTGVGYFGVAQVVCGLRKRIDMKAVPESFRGVPIYLATLAIISFTVYAFA